MATKLQQQWLLFVYVMSASTQVDDATKVLCCFVSTAATVAKCIGAIPTNPAPIQAVDLNVISDKSGHVSPGDSCFAAEG